MTHGGGRTLSQNFSSLAHTVCNRKCLEDYEQKDHGLNKSMNESINQSQRFNKTAPVTTGFFKRPFGLTLTFDHCVTGL